MSCQQWQSRAYIHDVARELISRHQMHLINSFIIIQPLFLFLSPSSSLSPPSLFLHLSLSHEGEGNRNNRIKSPAVSPINRCHIQRYVGAEIETHDIWFSLSWWCFITINNGLPFIIEMFPWKISIFKLLILPLLFKYLKLGLVWISKLQDARTSKNSW